MKYLVRGFGVLMFLAVLLGMTACDGETPGDVDVSLLAVVENRPTSSRDVDPSFNATPTSYKIAMKYFALVRDDGVKVALVNSDTPVIKDFSGHFAADTAGPLLLGTKRIPPGRYVGYEMQIVYLEMDLLCSFSIPSWANDTSPSFLNSISDANSLPTLTYTPRTIRQYFNDDGIYQKRDILVDVDETGTSPDWRFMRRELESNVGTHTWFFLATRPVPPTSDDTSGPYQVIDLFDDATFWGSDDVLVIQSGSATGGGLDATLDAFTVSATTDLLLEIDILNSFSFYEDASSQYNNSNSTTVNLDFGPSCREVPSEPDPVVTYQLGDKGFHPKMPAFHLKKR